MGVNISNVGTQVDYSTGEKFVELHRKIILSDSDYSSFTTLLDDNKLNEAKELLIKAAPSNAENVINAFFDDLAQIKLK